MSDVIETRTLWESGELVITGEMLPDDVPAEDLMGDFDTPEDEAEFRRHLENGDLEYVGMVVTVTYAGAEIASDSLWGIESGYLGTYDGREVCADAWEVTPADYGPELYEGRSVIMMGSPLSGVIDEAIGNAREWADANGSDAMRTALDAAQAWADPNAHKRVGE